MDKIIISRRNITPVALGRVLDRTHLASKVSIFVPPDDLDISDRGYTSTQIDAYLIYHADILGTNNAEMDIRGNENPTSASAAARQTLFDNYVLVNYNTGYTP